MAKYITKPVVIEAEQWLDSANPPKGCFVEPDGLYVGDPKEYGRLYGGYCKTRQGKVEAQMNDWIITLADGESYPCKADVFENKYKKLEE